MTYLEKWFDYNRRQKEMEALLEETIAQQSEQRLNLKEFYLLYYLNLAGQFVVEISLGLDSDSRAGKTLLNSAFVHSAGQ